MSGGFLSDSGQRLGGYDVDLIDRHKILINCVIFSQCLFSGNYGLKIGMGEKKSDAISSGPPLIPKSVLTSYGATERESNWVWWIPYTLGISVSLYSAVVSEWHTYPSHQLIGRFRLLGELKSDMCGFNFRVWKKSEAQHIS